MRRYRLIWENVVYEPGELRVVAYDADGRPAAERTVRTASKPYALRLDCKRTGLKADGDDLAYVTVSVVNRNGTPCPDDSRLVKKAIIGTVSSPPR